MEEDREEEIKKLLVKYQNLAIQHCDAAEDTLNYKKTNRIADKMVKLFDSFSKDDTLAEEILTRSIHNEDVRIRIWAATHCLILKKHIDEALDVLGEASKMKEMMVLSFSAEWTIKTWNRRGYL